MNDHGQVVTIREIKTECFCIELCHLVSNCSHTGPTVCDNREKPSAISAR